MSDSLSGRLSAARDKTSGDSARGSRDARSSVTTVSFSTMIVLVLNHFSFDRYGPVGFEITSESHHAHITLHGTSRSRVWEPRDEPG